MPCNAGRFRSRHGWQRHSAVGILVFLIHLLTSACGPSPRRLYADAEALRRADRIDEALQAADRALAATRGRPDWFHRLRVLKGELLVLGGRPKEALALAAEDTGVAIPNAEARAGYLYVRGYALSQLSAVDARPLLEEAARTAAGAHLASLDSTVLVRLGTVLFTVGDQAGAEKCYTSALAEANAAHDPYLQARAAEALGFIDLQNVRYDECAIWSARALDTYRALRAEIRMATVSVNLGWCDYRLGNHDEARKLFASAQSLFTSHQQWQALGINLNSTGAAAVADGDLSAARSDYERVIELAGRTGDVQTLAYGRTNLATTLILLGDLDAAQSMNQQAQSLPADRVQQETRLRMELNAGRIAAVRGRLADAEKTCRAVASSGVNQPRFVIDADVLLAQVLEREGRPRDAESALRHAITVLDDSRAELSRDESKLTYSDTLMPVFRQYVELLCRQKRYDDALEIAESSRARLLSEHSNIAKAPHPSAYQELSRSTGVVFLFYWIAPRQSHLWAIAPSGIVHATLAPDVEVRALVESYRKSIEGFGDPLAADGVGQQLYNTLLEPVRQVVPAGCKVVIVPDGPLFDLNFEALPVPASPAHYWLQDVTVSVAPSLSFLLQPATAAQRRPARLLLIGDAHSAEGKDDFPRLANAGKEIDRIRAEFPPGASVLRTGGEATPGAYAGANPSEFSLIHFAAHATANRQSPLDSAVILTARDGKNKLYARDIRNCPIGAELVTLSACRSAGARTYAGEGLVGFAWAFLGAGARNVVAGLWEVDDRSTAQLMQRMYAELRRGAAPAEALRHAKLELAGSSGIFRKPYYWAPFELFTVSL